MNKGLQCKCGSVSSTVTDSRPGDGYIRRRRRCYGCGARMTTYEVYGPDKDGLRDQVARIQAALDQAEALLREAVPGNLKIVSDTEKCGDPTD